MADGGQRESPLRLTTILGRAGDEALRERIHDMRHRDEVETVLVTRVDAARRRMRLVTDKGRDCVLMLPREHRLENGAVLFLVDDLAVVAKIENGPRLRLIPADASSALRIGYHCGNLHWAASFEDGGIEIEMDGLLSDYLRRLEDVAVHADFRVERPDE